MLAWPCSLALTPPIEAADATEQAARRFQELASRNSERPQLSDDATGFQCSHIALAHAEPRLQHVLRVLAQQRRWLHLRRLSVMPHGPGRHLELSTLGVLDGLHDAALLEGRIVVQ